MPLSETNLMYNLADGQPQGLSLRLRKYFNIISAANRHKIATIQRRQQATALPRRCLLRIVRNSSLSLPTFADCGQGRALPVKGSLVKGAVIFWNKKMTEGFLQNHIKSTSQSLRLTFVRHLPLQGRLKCGCPTKVPFTREAETHELNFISLRHPSIYPHKKLTIQNRKKMLKYIIMLKRR